MPEVVFLLISRDEFHDQEMKMDTTGSYLKFLGVIAGITGGILLLGYIFKWLGILHIYFLVWEVVLRAITLGCIAFIAWLPIKVSEKDDEQTHILVTCIVLPVAFIAAAITMAFWEQIFPGF